MSSIDYELERIKYAEKQISGWKAVIEAAKKQIEILKGETNE